MRDIIQILKLITLFSPSFCYSDCDLHYDAM